MKRKIVLVLMFTAAMCFFSGCNSKNNVEMSTEDGYPTIHTSNTVDKSTYVDETTYKGSELNAALFEIPFQSSNDSTYESNKEIMEDTDKDEIKNYLETAQKAVSTIYLNDYMKIADNQEDFSSTLSNLYASEDTISRNGEEYSKQDYIDKIMETYVDNKLILDGKFTTDTSLYYMDSYVYHVRGLLTVTMKSDATEAYEDLSHISLQNGETKEYVVEVRFMGGNPNEILGIDILMEVK